jgi:hypothetical protein
MQHDVVRKSVTVVSQSFQIGLAFLPCGMTGTFRFALTHLVHAKGATVVAAGGNGSGNEKGCGKKDFGCVHGFQG